MAELNWIPATEPPHNGRTVILWFGEAAAGDRYSMRWAPGWYQEDDQAYYDSRGNRCKPTHWADVEGPDT
jgi:hypothetical protein